MKNQSITSLPRSPYDDRRARMIKYSLAMGIRMICILSLLFVQGWWLVIMATGAIVLPYIAVVLANVGSRPGGGVEAPGGREVMLRNPQTPVIVPAAEEPAPESGSRPFEPQSRAGQEPQFGRGQGPRFGQGSEQPFRQAPGEGSAQTWVFPPSGQGPFAQPAGPSSAHPYSPSGETAADRQSAERPDEDQA